METGVLSRVPVAAASKLRLMLLVVTVIFLNAVGNLALAWGMKQAPEVDVLKPLTYLRPMWNPAVALGITLLILWLLTRMTLLSWADLSFVLPLTSLGYVLAAVLGKIFLHESVTAAHWLGTGLIFAGTFLVGTTEGRTTAEEGTFG